MNVHDLRKALKYASPDLSIDVWIEEPGVREVRKITEVISDSEGMHILTEEDRLEDR